MLRLVVDGSADMPDGWQSKYDVHVIPLNIHFGDRQFIQGVDITMDEFYRLVNQNRTIPTTSLPSPHQIAEFYNQLAKVGDTILSIHLGSKLSGTFAATQLAAKEVMDKFNVVTYDSGSGSAVLTFMTKEARDLERSGATIEQIIRRLEYIRRNVTLIFTVDSLEFARMSGRVNHLEATVSAMLKIKPIILLKDGLLDMADKVRTRSRSIDRMVDMVRERVGNRLVNLAVVHASDRLTAGAIMERVSKIFDIEEAFIAELSTVVAAHLGPHTVGIVAYPVHGDEDGGEWDAKP